MNNNKFIKYKNKLPEIDKSVFVAEGVKIIGDVKVGKGTNIWFNCVVRADVNFIKIGENTNIQDGTVIHVSSNGFSANGKKGFPTIIGDNVTIGHNATIHACTIQNYSLVGMGAIILDKSVIEEMAFVAAGSLVPPGTLIKKKELWAGNPAKFIRQISDIEEQLLLNTPKVYFDLSKDFLKK
jgi:carbonic anhydrase/acetyltransferase-like protein (isoleucine patch superfamily)